jgi:hypothetical protein
MELLEGDEVRVLEVVCELDHGQGAREAGPRGPERLADGPV